MVQDVRKGGKTRILDSAGSPIKEEDLLKFRALCLVAGFLAGSVDKNSRLNFSESKRGVISSRLKSVTRVADFGSRATNYAFPDVDKFDVTLRRAQDYYKYGRDLASEYNLRVNALVPKNTIGLLKIVVQNLINFDYLNKLPQVLVDKFTKKHKLDRNLLERPDAVTLLAAQPKGPDQKLAETSMPVPTQANGIDEEDNQEDDQEEEGVS